MGTIYGTDISFVTFFGAVAVIVVLGSLLMWRCHIRSYREWRGGEWAQITKRGRTSWYMRGTGRPEGWLSTGLVHTTDQYSRRRKKERALAKEQAQS